MVSSTDFRGRSSAVEREAVAGGDHEGSLQHHSGVSSWASSGAGGVQAYWVRHTHTLAHTHTRTHTQSDTFWWWLTKKKERCSLFSWESADWGCDSELADLRRDSRVGDVYLYSGPGDAAPFEILKNTPPAARKCQVLEQESSTLSHLRLFLEQ